MPKSYLIDMDGVIVRGNELVPGADEFLQRLHDRQIKFLILTNNPQYTPVDLQYRLASIGANVSAEHIYTSAIATAQFLKWQQPNGTAFAIGEVGLTEALHSVGYVLTEKNPDFVVLGETTPDPSGPGEGGLVPACGAIAALIETATGIEPYFIGKPNPLMMRAALRYLGEHSENTIMVGDRMETDVRVGLESGLETILVLSGVTASAEDIEHFPYRPTRVIQSVAELELD
jgi:NagD protein